MSKTRYIRLVDRQPTQARYTRLSDVTRSIEVSMEFKPTFAATEGRPFAVPFVDMPAFRTFLRGVPSIYKKNVLSESFCFVPEKLLKLVERPTVELSFELLASSLLNSNLAQILKSKHCVIRVHDLLRYAMVNVSHKPSFSARKLPQLPFCRPSAFGLQLFSKVSILRSSILHFLRVVKGIIGADCYIHNPTIDTNYIEILKWLRVRMFKRYVEEEHIGLPIVGYRGRFDFPQLVRLVTIRDFERGFDPSFGGCDGGNTVDQVHSNNSLIVSHRSKRLPFWKRLTFDRFQRFASAISSALHQRRREFCALTDMLVGGVVVINLVPRLVLESPFHGFRKCFGVCSHRVMEHLTVLLGQPELECYRPKHIHIEGG